MAKISQRFWSFVVVATALAMLSVGCGRNDLPAYGGEDVGGAPSAGSGNRAGFGNSAGFGNNGGAPFCGDGLCGPGESMDTCIGDCHPLCHDGKCDLKYDPLICPEDCA